MTAYELWSDVEARRGGPDGDEPGLEMRFHDEWWHTIFSSARGHQVLLSPVGIDLGWFPTLTAAKAAAKDNARTRALNTLATARQDIQRGLVVLAALSA